MSSVTTGIPHNSPVLPVHPEELRFNDLWFNRGLQYVVFLVAAAIGLLAGLVVTLQSPHLYTATATLELNPSASGLGLKDFSGTPSQSGTGTDFMLDLLTLQEVLTSDDTDLAVIKKLGLMSEYPYNRAPEGAQKAAYEQQMQLPLEQAPLVRDRALTLFRAGLHVAPVKNTRLMAIAYSDPSAERAAQIANTIVDSYLMNYSAGRSLATSDASSLVNQQLADLKRHVEDTHKEVSSLEQSTGMMGAPPLLQSTSTGSFNPDAYDSPAYQRLKALNAELTRVEIIRLAKQSIYELTQSNDPEVILQVAGAHLSDMTAPGNSLDAASRSLQLIQTLHNEETSLRLRIASNVTYGAGNPVVIEENKRLDAIQAQMKDEVRSVRKATKMEYLLAVSTEDSLRRNVSEQQQKVGTMSANIARLAFLQQEENTNRALYQNLYTRLGEANAASGVRSSPVTVVDPARVPSKPSSPVLRKNLLIGLAAGALLGYFVALFLRPRAMRVFAPTQVVNA